MLLETSDKTSNFGKKAHVKKGYYPGKLLKVELFCDKDGKPRVGKYGQQLIFEFEVWKADENDVPIEVLKDAEDKNVTIPKFVYHKYKNTDKAGNWTEGDYRTAITLNSNITKVLESLGWKFSTEPVDPESFIGNFVELNLDDYTQGEGSESYVATTIKDISNAPSNPESAEPKEVTPEVQAQIDKLEEVKKNLDNLKKTEGITDQGYADGMEQIEHDIKKLKA